ncbi:MAG: hypothetical protein Kilf2KO_06230 [Rhodospirillales bacterium]
MRTLTFALALGLTTLSSGAMAATVTTFDNRNDFQSGLTNIVVENFGNGQVNAPFSVTSTVGEVENGMWSDRLTPGGNTTLWTFDSPTNAFGGFWDLAGPAGPGTGIALTVTLFQGGSQLLSTELSRFLQGDFFGVILDESFTSMLLTAGTQPGRAETYKLDNLTIGTLAPVPLPASVFLLGGGIGGLMLVGWRRRRAQAAA